MDIYVFISVLSVMYSWILCTALSAPTAETAAVPAAAQRRHVRTKRCSCATFLDKECVYFCHLDIIWVNTPERVVSYGMGNAPRAKRAAAAGSMATDGPRCQCLRQDDDTCRSFCLRYEPSPATVIRSARGDGCGAARCRQQLAADAGGIKRLRPDEKQASPPALEAVLKTRLLLEKWRVRRRHRARAWEGESTAA